MAGNPYLEGARLQYSNAGPLPLEYRRALEPLLRGVLGAPSPQLQFGFRPDAQGWFDHRVPGQIQVNPASPGNLLEPSRIEKYVVPHETVHFLDAHYPPNWTMRVTPQGENEYDYGSDKELIELYKQGFPIDSFGSEQRAAIVGDYFKNQPRRLEPMALSPNAEDNGAIESYNKHVKNFNAQLQQVQAVRAAYMQQLKNRVIQRQTEDVIRHLPNEPAYHERVWNWAKSIFNIED